MSKKITVIEDPRVNFSAEDRAKKKAALNQLLPLVTQATFAGQTVVNMRTAVSTAIESWKRPGAAQVPDNVKKAADDLLKKIDELYPSWGTPPGLANPIGSAGPPLVELPTPLNQRVAQLMGAIEGTSGAPTTWELDQIKILSQKIPEAAGKTRSLTDDLNALNKMMRDANIPYIVMPQGGGGGGRRPGDEDDDGNDDFDN